MSRLFLFGSSASNQVSGCTDLSFVFCSFAQARGGGADKNHFYKELKSIFGLPFMVGHQGSCLSPVFIFRHIQMIEAMLYI